MFRKDIFKRDDVKKLINSIEKDEIIDAWWGGRIEATLGEKDIKDFINSENVDLATFVEFLGKCFLYKRENTHSLISKSSKNRIQGFDGMFLYGQRGKYSLLPYEAKSTSIEKSLIKMAKRAINDFKNKIESSVKISDISEIKADVNLRSLVDLSTTTKLDLDEHDYERISKTIDSIISDEKYTNNIILSVNTIGTKEEEAEKEIKKAFPDIENIIVIHFDLEINNFEECFIAFGERYNG